MRGTYAIIGGAGFVGTNLALALLARGDAVSCLDHPGAAESPNVTAMQAYPGFRFVGGDVCDATCVRDFLDGEFDAVFHLASVVGVRNYLRDPMRLIEVNITGTRNVAQICAARDLRLVFTSTSEVLGRNPDAPWAEDADRVYGAPTVDRWAYGTSKGLAEHMLNAMVPDGLRASIVRFFNVYGPYQQPYFVVSKSLQHAMRGEAPLVYDSGKQTRCFTYIGDAVEACLAIAATRATIGGTYHIGSRFEWTIADIIAVIQRVTGNTHAAERFDTGYAYGTRYEDIERRVPDVSKIQRDTGWTARTDVETGIRRFRDWAYQNAWWMNLDNRVV